MNMKDMATPLAYISNTTFVLFGVSIQSWSAVIGIIGLFATFGVNLYYKRAARKDRQALHEKLLAQGRNPCDVPYKE